MLQLAIDSFKPSTQNLNEIEDELTLKMYIVLFSAIAVKYITKRFIGEYDSTLGWFSLFRPHLCECFVKLVL